MLKPAEGDHAYVPLLPLAFNAVFPPGQTTALFPAFTEGLLPVVMVITLVAVPQLLVTASVYVVVTEGFATGFEMDALLSPVEGDHANDPLPDAVIETKSEGQIV